MSVKKIEKSTTTSHKKNRHFHHYRHLAHTTFRSENEQRKSLLTFTVPANEKEYDDDENSFSLQEKLLRALSLFHFYY